MKFGVAVAVVVVLSGCLHSEGGPDGEPTASSGPTPGSNPGANVGTAELPWGIRGVNMTGCAAERAAVRAPTQTVREQLPATYQPLETTPGTVTIIVEAQTCEKVAIGGVDMGAVSLQWTRIAILAPAVNAPTGRTSFVFEIRTSSPELVGYLQKAGIAATEGTSQHTATPLHGELESVSAEVRSRDQGLYSWSGVAVRPVLQFSATVRYYFGEDPTAPTIDQAENYTQSSQSGAAAVAFDATTTLASVFPGISQVPGHAISVRGQSASFVVN